MFSGQVSLSHLPFNPHTFRPWSYWLIWGEIPLFHIGSTSQNTCFMVHLSEPGLKTGTQAVTVRYRAKRWWARAACWHRIGISTLFCTKKPGIRWILWLNQRIPLPKAGKCLKTVGFGEISFGWWHKFFWYARKSYSKNRGIQHNKYGPCHPAVFSFSAVVLEASGGRIRNTGKTGYRRATHVRHVRSFEFMARKFSVRKTQGNRNWQSPWRYVTMAHTRGF